MHALANLTIVRKVYGLLALMFMVIITVSAVLIWTVKSTDTWYSNLIDNEVRVMVEEMRVRGDIQNFGRQMNNVLLVQKPPEGLDALQQALTNIGGTIDGSMKILAELGGARTVSSVAEFKADFAKVKQAAAAAIAAKRSGDPDQDAKARAAWSAPTGRALSQKLAADIAKLSDADYNAMNTLSDANTEVTNRTLWISAGVIAVSLLAAGFLAFQVATRGIARPLGALGATMRRLADRDMEVEVPGAARHDEIGAMAKTVQVFKDNALRTHALEEEQAQERRAAEDARAGHEAQRAHAAKAATVAVGSIGAGLERLAAGDLTCRLDQGFAPEYERLRADFNAAVGQLRDAMGGILANTAAIRSGTGEIAHAADDLSRRTEQQAASLEETAAALDEITATVKRTADGSNQARTIVATARTDAERSGAVVRDAVTAMGEIEKSSQQIGQIIGVIDEIAFQTNLLALNAGVEAARAGDAGRGFAVVAQEVRALAQRSAEAAKEIKALIGASTQHVSQGVKLVGETGQALGRIVTQVSEISATIVEIASSAQEQATGLHQVNAAVNQMDQVTQQNAAMVEQSTAASHALSQEAEELGRLTARFKTGDEKAGDRAEGLAPSAKAEHRPSNVAPLRPAARKSGPARSVALPAASRDGTARKLVPADEAESWTEF